MLYDAHVHMKPDGARAAAAQMALAGLDRYVLQSLSQEMTPLQNGELLLAKALDPEHCLAFCGLIHPALAGMVPDYLTQLRFWLNAGFDGLKLLETKPTCAKRLRVRLDDEAFEPMFAFCETQQIPITWHVGDPATFWDPETCPQNARENGWAYLDGTYPALRTLYEQTENVLRRHPKLKVTLAHFYFTSDDPTHAERMMEQYPNLRFDLTSGVEMYGGFTERREFFRPFFEKYADRLIFGTDSVIPTGPDAWGPHASREQRRFLETEDEFDFAGFSVKGFGLPEPITRKILWENACAFAGAAPKKLSPAGAAAAMLELIRQCAPLGLKAEAEALWAKLQPLL